MFRPKQTKNAKWKETEAAKGGQAGGCTLINSTSLSHRPSFMPLSMVEAVADKCIDCRWK